MAKWDDDRILNATEEFITLVETGKINPNQVSVTDILNLGGDLAPLMYNFRRDRPQWAKDLFPDTETDPTGFESFLKFVQDMNGNGTHLQRARPCRDEFHMPGHIEAQDIQGASELYRDGEWTKEEAIKYISENLGITLSPLQEKRYFPEHPRNGNGLEQTLVQKKPKDIQKRARRLKKQITEELKVPTRPNLLLYLGDVYQNLVGAAVSLAHIDDRVFPETALTWKKDDEGRLKATKNIVDYLVVQDKIKRGEDPKVILYEIKLGRQRSHLEEQLIGQQEAAEKQGFELTSQKLVCGSKFELPQASRENQKKSIEFEEQLYGLQNINEAVNGVPNLEIYSLMEVVGNAIENMSKKYEKMGAWNPPFNKNFSAEEKAKLQETIKKLGKYNEESFTDFFTSMFQFFNLELQYRDLSLEELAHYDQNLYLLNHYINTKFRKAMKDSKLKRYELLTGENPIEELRGIMQNMFSHTAREMEQRKEILPEETIDQNISSTEKLREIQSKIYNATVGKLRKKKMTPQTPEEIKKSFYGMTLIEFWSQYLTDPKKILSERNRNNIWYYEKGLREPFRKGRRAHVSNGEKENSNQWVLNELEQIGTNTQGINIDDPQQLEDCLDVLEQYYNAYNGLETASVEMQKKILSNKISKLEKIASNQGFEEKGKIKQRDFQKYQQILTKFGLEDKLDDLAYLRRTRKTDNRIRKTAQAIDFLNPFVKRQGVKNRLDYYSIIRRVRDELRKKVHGDFKNLARNVLARAQRKAQEKERKEILNMGWEIYDKFTNTGEVDSYTLGSFQEFLMTYVARIGKNINKEILREAAFANPNKKTIRNYIDRSRLFERTNLLEKYATAKMLQIIGTTKAIYDLSPEAGKQYFDLARQELKEGKKYGSQEIVESTLEHMKEIQADDKKMLDYYLPK